MSGTCQKCKHWDPAWDGANWGYCAMMESDNSEPLVSHTRAFADYYRASVKTHFTFGCVQFTVSQRNIPAAQMLRVGQVAELLGVHPNTIRNWTRNGRLPAARIGSRHDRRYPKDVVMRYMDEHR